MKSKWGAFKALTDAARGVVSNDRYRPRVMAAGDEGRITGR
ncbi:hypothetical protein [Sinorhizobium terangae]|nr:hypothetical protein [Sinorhizobium terangae]WFU47346.1 hypothetical protein QA637_15985 [Sinorhizobium terangae]